MNEKKNLTTKETFVLAVKNHKKNNLKVAENLYNKILKIDPNHIETIFSLGSLSAQTRKFDKAKQLFQKAIQINPNYANTHYNLGIVFKELGEYQKAINCYQKAIQLNPSSTDAYLNLGVVFKNLKKHQKAINCYQKAIQLNPSSTDAYLNLGVVFEDVKEHQKAINCYQKVIEIQPDYVKAYYNLGIIFNELEEREKAISYYKKAIEINPYYAEAHNNLEIIFRELGEFESSYNYHIKFLQLKSEGTVSNAKLENVIPKLAKKLQHQKGINTFFDNAVHSQLTKKNNPTSDYCDVFEKGQLSKENRFISYSERVKGFSKSVPTSRLFHGLPFVVSQGVHSLIKWKEIPLYKTAFDLTIYSMILQEVKPDVIIELGSGSGGSAIWLADTAIALGLDTHVYSFDINKPLINHDKVTFIEHDLSKINKQNKPPCWKLFTGKKIIMEDAHVNLKDILYLFDTILKKDDYLIIEDSEEKQDIISHFSTEKEPKYKLDQFFIDFFGTNITCCVNSIFKCY